MFLFFDSMQHLAVLHVYISELFTSTGITFFLKKNEIEIFVKREFLPFDSIPKKCYQPSGATLYYTGIRHCGVKDSKMVQDMKPALRASFTGDHFLKLDLQ